VNTYFSSAVHVSKACGPRRVRLDSGPKAKLFYEKEPELRFRTLILTLLELKNITK